MNYTVFVQKMTEHNKVLQQALSQPFYKMLLALSQNLIAISQLTCEIIETDIQQGFLQDEGEELLVLLEEVEEAFQWILDQPLEKLVLKRVFEILEQPLADLDDVIEDINEYLEEQGKVIPYVENWDVGFFFE